MLDSGELLVTGFGHIYTSAKGIPFPANIAAPVSGPAGWIDHGYADNNGVKFDFTRNVNEIYGWQSYEPLRTIIKTIPKKLSFSLLQWNVFNLLLAQGGGSVTEPSAGQFLFEPPDPSFVDERQAIIEGTDGDRNYRFCYRKVLNEAGVQFNFNREVESLLPITLSVLAADGGLRAFFVQSDDPALSALAGDS